MSQTAGGSHGDLRWQIIIWLHISDAVFPYNVSLNFNVCLLHDTEI